MARTIGNKNIGLVKKIVRENKYKGIKGINELIDIVMATIPSSVLDIWEGAYTEIERIVCDEAMIPTPEEKLLKCIFSR